MINIHKWMWNNLKLKKCDLLIYAIIYSFTIGKKGLKKFIGGQKYLATVSGASNKTIIKTLNNLESKGLITKTQASNTHGKCFEYTANPEFYSEFVNTCEKQPPQPKAKTKKYYSHNKVEKTYTSEELNSKFAHIKPEDM